MLINEISLKLDFLITSNIMFKYIMQIYKNNNLNTSKYIVNKNALK